MVRSPALIASLVDEWATTRPDARFALVTAKVDSTDGCRDVTWSMFRHAVDAAAAWIETTFGKPDTDHPALGFMSTPFDVRYCIFIIACIKTGYTAFLPSPRNSPDFHTHLLNKLSCNKLIAAIPVGEWASACSVKQCPSLDDLLDATDVSPYPYTRIWEQAKDDPVIAVHSSGSTGPPKPIVWTNSFVEAARKVCLRKTVGGEWMEAFTQEGDSRLMMFPLFHAAGLLMGPLYSFFLDKPMTMFPIGAMPSSTAVAQLIHAHDFKTALIPPSILEDMSSDLKVASALSKVSGVGFGGGPLAPTAGKILGQFTRLYNGIGSSEAGMYPNALPVAEDSYNWFQFDDNPGFVFEPQEDGLFELVWKRTEDFDWPVFHAFPQLDEFRTNDLYEKHPHIPGAVKLISRKDEVLVLSNGEKVVPMPMEDALRRAPIVEGVIYSGQARFSVAAVVQLTPGTVESQTSDEIRQTLEPYLSQANAIAPGFAQLSSNMIIFASPDKPFRRTGKNTFIRKAILKDYEQEIEKLYTEQSNGQTVNLVQGLSEDQTISELMRVVQQTHGHEIGPDEDLFQAGMDSLQVLTTTRIIGSSLKAAGQETASVTPSLIYENPTITALARAVRHLAVNGSTAVADHRVDAMNAMLLKYSHGMTGTSVVGRKQASPKTVLLTGSTGSLGSYMLDTLIHDSAIGRIFCLNRSGDAADRQNSNNAIRGLSTDFSKVTFLTANFGSANLGLSSDSYNTLVGSVDLIIHNAWPVNFNHPLSSFDTHIRGSRTMIDLAAASLRNPHITFVSSIAVSSFWDIFYPEQSRPEELLRDPRTAAGQGYGESKYVVEHLLAVAKSAGISATVARVGQVAGPITKGSKGMWNKQEWLPSIIASSKYLHALPDSLGNDAANWIPVDFMANAILELGFRDFAKAAASGDAGDSAGSKPVGELEVYNLVNPEVGSFSSLLDTIRKHLPEIKEIVSYEKWVQLVEESGEKADNDPVANPAIKLLPFYQSLIGVGLPIAFDIAKVRQNSKTVAGLSAVQPEWMDIWMEQWAF